MSYFVFPKISMEFRDKFVWVTIRSSMNPWMSYIYQFNEIEATSLLVLNKYW